MKKIYIYFVLHSNVLHTHSNVLHTHAVRLNKDADPLIKVTMSGFLLNKTILRFITRFFQGSLWSRAWHNENKFPRVLFQTFATNICQMLAK